ncbi:MAG: acetamidase/formamidase family protein [Candidatus Lutacidiplasmatales archaeon]
MGRLVRVNGCVPSVQQTTWSRDAAPVAQVRSGDRLRVQLPDSSTGQLGPRSASSDLGSIDLDRVDAATGPVEVVDARPGDRLDLHIRWIRPRPWGWSGVFRDFGLLRGRFDDELQHWRIGPSAATPVGGFVPPVRIPLRPMLGWVGLAPRSGPHPMIPPRRTGGNLDHRLVGAGSTLSLPVEVDGALLSLGDPHAAQGDGEVCGTGIEVPAEVELEVMLRPGAARAMPFLRASAPAGNPGPQIACLGVGPDLGEASVAALEGLLEEFDDRGVPAKAGYVLASVAGELRITEAVDMPNYVVSASYPERLVPAGRKVKRRGGSATRRRESE